MLWRTENPLSSISMTNLIFSSKNLACVRTFHYGWVWIGITIVVMTKTRFSFYAAWRGDIFNLYLFLVMVDIFWEVSFWRLSYKISFCYCNYVEFSFGWPIVANICCLTSTCADNNLRLKRGILFREIRRWTLIQQRASLHLLWFLNIAIHVHSFLKSHGSRRT